MKLISPIISGNPVALLAGLLLIPAGSQAAQLAYEGFDYPGSGTLTGQTGGSGWNGAWLTVNNGGADLVTGSLAVPVSSPAGFDLRSIGSSVLLPNNRRVGRKLDTSASGPFGSRGFSDANGRIGADGKTIYLSFIQQPDGVGAYYEFELHRGDLGDSGRIGGIGNDQSGTTVNLRAPNGTHTPIGEGTTDANFYVVRIDFKAGNDDVHVYRNPTSATEPGTPTLTRPGAADLSFDGISFGAFNNSRVVGHDEVRVGESWEDVTVPAPAQPAITRQPRASTTGFVGATVVLTAESSGQPLPSYQWFKGSSPLDGQTAATLTLANLQAGDAGAYHLTATNAGGTATTSDAQVVVQTAPAGLLAYEGFDYNTGAGNLAGMASGLGWGDRWTNVNGGGGNVISSSLAAGTNAPNGYDAVSLGNSSHLPNAQRDGRLVDTSATGRFGAAGYVDGSGNIGADGKSLYISFLQQPDGTSQFYEFEFHRGSLGDPGRIGGIGNDTTAAQVSLRTAGTQTLIGPGSTAVNFYVVRIDYKDGNDDVHVYQNPVSATEPGVATLTRLDAADLSFNGISLAAFANGRTVKHDEIRIGQSWSDVVFGTSRRNLVWAGNSTTNTWDFTSPNWNDGSGATAFADGDPVSFNDTGSDTPAVNVPAAVSTSLIAVDTTNKNYTFSGPGPITSSGGLTKAGTAALIFNTPATFGAAITVDGGELTLGGTTTVGGELRLASGVGAVTLSGANRFTGSLNAIGGSVALSGTNEFTGFVATNSSATLTGATTITGQGGTNVWIGNLIGANASVTIEPGATLDIGGVLGDAWVIGRDGGNGAVIQNGGTVTYHPTNRDSAYIGASASGNTVATYDLNGGTLEMSGKRLGLAIGPITAHLRQTGGALKVNQLELGSNLLTGTGIYDLTGGVITVGAGGITSFSGLYEVNLNGGSLAAAADWVSPLEMNLVAAATPIDTAGHRIELSGGLTGTGGLVKSGAGSLALNGFKSYSGTTTVSAGTLTGAFGNDATALTVASGAILAPGSETGIGTIYVASASLASGSALAVKIDSSTGTADQLAALESIQLTGASLALQEIAGGLIPPGDSLVIVDSVSGSVSGTFTGYPNGSKITAGANTFEIRYQPSQVVLIAVAGSAYSGWAATRGLDGSPGKDPAFHADPDLDGVPNGLEWLLGGDPLARDGSSLVTMTGTAATGVTLNFNREETAAAATTLVVQWSTSLNGDWNDVPVTQAGGTDADGVTVAVNPGATPDAVTVTIPASNAEGGRLFARLRAVLP